MNARTQIERTVEALNKDLKPNNVHTCQFVSLDENDLSKLTWHTLSLDKDTYTEAVLSFTGFDQKTAKIERTLVQSEYLEGPYWYRDLGDNPIIPAGGAPKLDDYSFEDYPNQGFSTHPYENIQLTQFWFTTLQLKFANRGSTMWVSQRHSEAGMDLVSSVFVLFNDHVLERLRYPVAKQLRDFLINYIVSLYKEKVAKKVEEHFVFLQDEYRRVLADDLRNQNIGQQIFERLRVLNPAICSDVPLLITGERGTGKGCLAKRIHEISGRGGLCKFMSCAGDVQDPESLKGNWSGTLIIDDIHLATGPMQRQLRELVERKPTCRLIFVGSADLRELVRVGMFAEDLYYQINAFEIYLPPLRNRKNEMIAIANAVLGELNAWERIFGRKQLGSGAIEKLKMHDYPSNIRELRNILLRAYVLCRTQTIEANDIIF
jgi:sigma-54-interacting transcriptional regulator